MYEIKNFTNNDDVNILVEKGPFTVIEYKRDLSVTPSTAMAAYYCNEMNVRKRQVVCDLSKANGITCQSGAMQWSAGNVFTVNEDEETVTLSILLKMSSKMKILLTALMV